MTVECSAVPVVLVVILAKAEPSGYLGPGFREDDELY
jgi:hypothetical protein